MAAMTQQPFSPSRSSSSRHSRSPQLSLDLTDLPPLVQPSPPSNTILITNLQDPAIFSPPTLAHLRNLICQHSSAAIHSFSPLRSMTRIIISFYDVDSAITVRGMLDGSELFGHRVRVYFGEPTPINPMADRHLHAPEAVKQFFISPPPSPPHGWESKEEGPPNRDVHADDLVLALQRLSATKDHVGPGWGNSPVSPVAKMRSRSSTIVYQPENDGHSPVLPAIAVEDMTESPDDDQADLQPELQTQGKPMLHTARPPVELMSES